MCPTDNESGEERLDKGEMVRERKMKVRDVTHTPGSSRNERINPF